MSSTSRAHAFTRWRRGLVFLLTAASLVFGCESAREEPTGGETHFLRRCDANDPSAPCGGALACLCNVCTLPCSQQTACAAHPAAKCVAPSASDACSGFSSEGHCDVECVVDADCAVLSSFHRCEQGACRQTASSCVGTRVSANQVLLIGDSFLATTHQITAYLEDLARSVGALAAGERYRDNSSLLSNGLALGGNGIAGQYAAGLAEAEVKVVIMNGGGADVLLGSCDTVSSECATLVDAAAAARSLLARMASDGVEHVFYAFYADPVDPAVRERMDALRPLIQSACESSPVPCHWIDLRTAFAGHYADYIRSDGLNPTPAGAQASAAAIWSTMQAYCVAQ
jgi:hypothetical protein